MRWQGQQIGVDDDAALPGMERLDGLVRSVTTPEFAGVTFHEVLAKSALNHVPGASAMPFDWTINPYRGCTHACTYCLSPETLILMADGRSIPIGRVRVGDEIIGTEQRGASRRYVRTTVRARWTTRKRAYRVLLADGTEIVASGDHRFLSDRGWKHVAGGQRGADRRAHLTTRHRLQGFGIAGPARDAPSRDAADYRHGYLSGMIRGDGMIFHGAYPAGGRRGEIHAFRLALADVEALDRARTYLAEEGIATRTRVFAAASATRREMTAIHTARQDDVRRIERLLPRPHAASAAWDAGFLAGVFDAEGSCSRGALRISNADPEMLRLTESALARHGIPSVREPTRENGVASIRVAGGLPGRQAFLRLARPAISRTLEIVGAAVETVADLRIVAIEDLGHEADMVDITTGTGDFIANGVISHNCFARGTHTYLDLDGGRDFDTQIVVKTNVADVLAREVGRGSWQREHVALGTNTDPYQRAEGRYRLMPGIVSTLAASGTPFSILTKGTLLRRDLPLLTNAAREVDVSIAMSIAVFDDELQRTVEPGTPTAAARLETVRAATEAGFRVTVFMMPVLPHLTDSIPALDDALRRIRAAGAARVVFGALHLRPGVKRWFLQWLSMEHPELVSSYARLYPGAAVNAPKEYRTWLARRMRPLLRVHGLDGRAESETARGHARPGPVRATGPASDPGPPRLF